MSRTYLGGGGVGSRGRVSWWRHTWTFQLAHGPLCRRHRRHVIRLGRLWLCRSCLALYASAVGVAVAVFVLRPSASLAAPLFVGVGVPVLLLSLPRLYARLPRPGRDLLRAGAGALLGAAVAWIFVGTWWVGLLLLILFLGLFLLYGRLRRRQRIRLCDGCEELGRGRVCSGYRRQAVRIRRYEEEWSARLEGELATLLQVRSPPAVSPSALSARPESIVSRNNRGR